MMANIESALNVIFKFTFNLLAHCNLKENLDRLSKKRSQISEINNRPGYVRKYLPKLLK